MGEKRLTIKELPLSERPRERMIKEGAAALSDADLLGVLLRTGTAEETAVQLGERILLAAGSLAELPRFGLDEFLAIKGMGPAKAVTLLAAIELANRLSSRSRYESLTISSPADAAGLVIEEMRHYLREHFRVLLLDTKNKVLGMEEISIGSLNTSLVHPREVFRPAIRKACASVILIHNHPSGDPTPSSEDIAVTRRLYEAGACWGLRYWTMLSLATASLSVFAKKVC